MKTLEEVLANKMIKHILEQLIASLLNLLRGSQSFYMGHMHGQMDTPSLILLLSVYDLDYINDSILMYTSGAAHFTEM